MSLHELPGTSPRTTLVRSSSSAGTPLEPRSVNRTFQAFLCRHGQCRSRPPDRLVTPDLLNDRAGCPETTRLGRAVQALAVKSGGSAPVFGWQIERHPQRAKSAVPTDVATPGPTPSFTWVPPPPNDDGACRDRDQKAHDERSTRVMSEPNERRQSDDLDCDSGNGPGLLAAICAAKSREESPDAGRRGTAAELTVNGHFKVTAFGQLKVPTSGCSSLREPTTSVLGGVGQRTASSACLPHPE